MADGVWQKIQDQLEQGLSEAEGGQWKEQSTIGDPNSPMNPKIREIWADLGFENRKTVDDANKDPDTKKYAAVGDKVPWCAVYAGHVLKQSGTGYLPKNASAIAFKERSEDWGGKAIGRRSYNEWRENDLLVMEGPSGGADGNHVGFLKAVDPKNNRYQIVGGNQGDSISEGVYYNLSRVYGVWRNWEVPADKDVPVIKDLSGYELSSKVK